MRDSEVRYYKYCLRCGRRLKSEQAMIDGFGKTCLEKERNKVKRLPLIKVKRGTCKQ